MDRWGVVGHAGEAFGFGVHERADPDDEVSPFDELTLGDRMTVGLQRIPAVAVELLDAHVHHMNDLRVRVPLITELLRGAVALSPDVNYLYTPALVTLRPRRHTGPGTAAGR